MKETRPITVGRVVRSKAGRDAGRTFVVTSLEGDDFVWMTDGGLRGLERPKRKRKKHLYVTEHVVDDLPERLSHGPKVENHEIRAWLKALEQKEE